MATQLPIADKTTLDAVNTKAGTNVDAAGTTTLFARLKQIYDYLTSNLSAARAAKIDAINTNVGSNADAASATGSVHAKVKDVKNKLNSMVSSVDWSNKNYQLGGAVNSTEPLGTYTVLSISGSGYLTGLSNICGNVDPVILIIDGVTYKIDLPPNCTMPAMLIRFNSSLVVKEDYSAPRSAVAVVLD